MIPLKLADLDGVDARMVREEVVSLVLGYTSIACWLGAQFPQIVVNWRRKSVDGLALPFLVNWFFGDTTNLIGCLLTGQLPFQTYLATYFVFVDVCLVTQYFYYDAAKDARTISALRSKSQSRTSLSLPPSLSYSSDTYTLPHANLTRPRSRSYSIDPHFRAAVANVSLATAELEARYSDPHVSDVDIPHSHTRWRSLGTRRAGSLEGLPESVVADTRPWPLRRERRISDAGGAAVDIESDAAAPAMVNSFYSEGGGRGRGRERHVSWSTNSDRSDRRPSNDPPRQESSNTGSTARGRQLTRPSMADSPPTAETSPGPSTRRRTASAASIVSAAASRRSAGIVFLGVFALFGLSTHVEYGTRKDVGMKGEVLTIPPAWTTSDIQTSVDLSSVSTPVSVKFSPSRQPHVPNEGETQQLIGRVSAWTCTTLYLTSRLPQIWKNFVRKSVEGLSMYLFVFAFLGNFFYVLSILTSPKMDLPARQALQFLRASIPYLLGSGGTLIFDVTIVLQSFIYKQRPPRPRRRRKSSSLAGVSEEERALLDTEATA